MKEYTKSLPLVVHSSRISDKNKGREIFLNYHYFTNFQSPRNHPPFYGVPKKNAGTFAGKKIVNDFPGMIIESYHAEW